MSEPENPVREVIEEPAHTAARGPVAQTSAAESQRPRAGRAPAAAASAPASRPPEPQVLRPSGLERALRGLRAALPVVQKVLPLLEGQIFTAASNLLAPHVAPRPADLTPLESGLADLRARHAELSNRLADQNQALKRVADRLEERLDQVQAAADRNALEQKELRDSLVSAGRKANLVAVLAVCLLALSVAANLFLFLHFQRALR
jgi:hypothetical protein